MAGGAKFGDEDEGITDINVVPLVDIMMVLLIIFMVTTEFVQQELRDKTPPNVEIQLPKAASAEDTNPSLLSIVMSHEGTLYLNGKKSSIPELRKYVLGLQKEGKKMEALIAADERLSHGQVVEVIDVLRLLGVGDVALNTKRQEIE